MRRAVDDAIVTLVGGPLYNVNVPLGGTSLRSLQVGNNQEYYRPWIDGEVTGTTPREPVGEAFWWGMQFLSPNDVSDDDRIAGVSRLGVELISITHEEDTGNQIIRVAGIPRATAAGAPKSSNMWIRYHIEVEGLTTGDAINLYAEGDLATPILTYTLIAADDTNLAAIGKPNAFYFTSEGILLVDDMFALDPGGNPDIDTEDTAGAFVSPVIVDGNGGYQEQASGAFADVNALPADVGTEIVLDAVDEASTYTVPATGTDVQVMFVSIHYKMTRTGSTAGVNMQARCNRRSVPATFVDLPANAAPGDGNVVRQFRLAWDGAAWDKSKYDDADFGLVSRT
jgi:hypothetical protein